MENNYGIKIFLKAYKKIILVFKKIKNKINEYTIGIVYAYKYNIFNIKKKLFLFFFFDFIFNKFFKKKNFYQVKASKVIFDIDQKELIIIDRLIPKNYTVLRDQFNKFHRAPLYNKIDDRAYYQDKIVGYDNLLSCKESEVFNHIKNYLHQQLKLKKNYGRQVPVCKFLGLPKSFLANQKKIDLFPGGVKKRINFFLENNQFVNLVPSLVEPWPIIDDLGIIFSDLSPVEFREAPYLHDLCYMLFKYELYGIRRKDHNFIFPIIFDALKKVADGEEKKIIGIELLNLAKLLNSIIGPQDFMDAYIMMVLFHSYVKFEATGKFTNYSSMKRFDIAVDKHIKILNLITC